MKRVFGLSIISLFFAVAPMAMAQTFAHGEAGAFADYYREADPSSPAINFVGVGGRVAFNFHPSIQMEAEMAYDFRRDYSSTYSNTVSTTLVSSNARVLHGFFGPKFQTGSGPFRVFVTGKVGFDNFDVTNQNAPNGFTTSVGLNNGSTHFALYPGAGFEAFAGPIGVRAEAGDDVFFSNGAHNNLRVSLGPQFRF
jgi:hypothetical protein